MDIIVNPPRGEWEKICSRSLADDPGVKETVEGIIERVRRGGDSALSDIEFEITGIRRSSFKVSDEEIAEACAAVPEDLKKAIATAAQNIQTFHEAQYPKEVRTEKDGVVCIQRPVPIKSVGLYIPGGTAPLFSTVLMLALPAKIAQCPRRVLCTPCSAQGKIAPAVLYAAHFCGITEIYKVGGAQAVAAMALGTESIAKVDKIFGPGNRYVTTAKQMLGGRSVAIDMPAGPSEVCVVADDGARPPFVAADLLSQAEHGRDSQVMLVCRSETFAREVQEEVAAQAQKLGRQEMIDGALSHSHAVILQSEEEMVEFAEIYAPEHLIIQTREPWRIVEKITAAGSVFVGEYTPESAGDYASGTNHTLPTSSWARSMSGVNIDSFIRKMTIQEITREGLSSLGETIVTMAQAEGLQAHAAAVTTRLK